MTPRFWKLSHGTEFFSYEHLLTCLEAKIVYVHKDTAAKGGAIVSQGEAFLQAPIGDYFYITHGNQGIYALGQFSGPANILSAKGGGWLDRPYRHIKSSITRDIYSGPQKWWTPDDNSTFMQVPIAEHDLFEQYILSPFFGLALELYCTKV